MPFTTPPPPEEQFFLRTIPLATSGPTLYLRHHGNGHNEIMLMPSPPKFIRGHFIPSVAMTSLSNEFQTGKIIFTSPSHPGRWFGVCMRRSKGRRASWESVEIVENEADDGFSFHPNSGELSWRPVLKDVIATEEDPTNDSSSGPPTTLTAAAGSDSTSTATSNDADLECKGFLALDWTLGHRQLFWITEAAGLGINGKEFGVERVEQAGLGERVKIVKESIPI